MLVAGEFVKPRHRFSVIFSFCKPEHTLQTPQPKLGSASNGYTNRCLRGYDTPKQPTATVSKPQTDDCEQQNNLKNYLNNVGLSLKAWQKSVQDASKICTSGIYKI